MTTNTVMDARPWEPLLDGTDAEAAHEAIAAIQAAVAEPLGATEGRDPDDARLASGVPGVALLDAYIASTNGRLDLRSSARDQLATTIQHAELGTDGLGLYFGLAGVAWVAQHLRMLDTEAYDDFIEPGFLRNLREALFECGYEGIDLFRGAVGVGTCALEFMPGLEALDLLRDAVRSIEEASLRDGGTRYWLVSPEYAVARGVIEGVPYINLGAPHGMAGLTAFLAHASLHVSEARSMYVEARDWLIQRADHRPATCRFGMTHGVEPHPSILALGWCYGDLGTANLLAAAAHAVGDPETLAYAADLAEHTLPLFSATVLDSGLCHGFAGVAHQYARLHQLTGRESLRTEAIRWYRRTLNARAPGRGRGGFFRCDDIDKVSTPRGFLRGASGVGLALLAGVTRVDPAWDRALLMSPWPPPDVSRRAIHAGGAGSVRLSELARRR